MVSGIAAAAAIFAILTWNYRYITVTQKYDGTSFKVRHGVDAWGPDALIIVGICAALGVFVLIMWAFARQLVQVWQVVLFGIADFIVGAIFGAVLWARIRDASFNAQEAWLGFACVAILVVAVLANHLFYHDRN